MLVFTTHFPDTDVFIAPVLAHVIHQPGRMFPAVIGNRFAILVGEVHRIHELAIDIQLDLAVCLVADPYWSGTAVTGQVRQVVLRQLIAAIQRIQDPQLARLFAAVTYAFANPAHESVGFVGIAQAHEGVDGKQGVADPRIAVIPVATAAQGLRQAESRGRNNAAVLARGQQLQGQGRAVDRFSPAPAVIGFLAPYTPERQGFVHVALAFAGVDFRVVDATQDELDELALFQLELGHGAMPAQGQGFSRGQAHGGLTFGAETDVVTLLPSFGCGATVVEAHRTTHANQGLAIAHFNPAPIEKSRPGACRARH